MGGDHAQQVIAEKWALEVAVGAEHGRLLGEARPGRKNDDWHRSGRHVGAQEEEKVWIVDRLGKLKQNNIGRKAADRPARIIRELRRGHKMERVVIVGQALLDGSCYSCVIGKADDPSHVSVLRLQLRFYLV